MILNQKGYTESSIFTHFLLGGLLMIVLHHLEYSQSFRILWLLEELGVEYELKCYERDKQTLLAPDEYKALSPLGSAPVISDGNLVLAESSAIMDYILDLHPNAQLRPIAGSSERADYLFWFHAAQASLMPLVLIDGVFKIIQARAPAILRPLLRAIFNKASDGFSKPRVKTLLEKAEADLAVHPWFAGEHLSGADIVLIYPMEVLKTSGHLEAYPNIQAWFERVYECPSFKAARKKDGKDSIALKVKGR